jgi:hypothetical protein
MILEEVYGNLATVYFQGTKEKIISILDHAYEKMPHNQSEGSNSNRMGICVFRNLTSSERQTNGHYGDVLVKGAVAVSNFYFTSFKEYKKLNPKANINTWQVEQIKQFGLENYTNALLGKTNPSNKLHINDYEGTTGYTKQGMYSRSVEILSMPKFANTIKGIEYLSSEDGECMYINNYRTIKIMKISLDKGKTWITPDQFLTSNNHPPTHPQAYVPRGEKDLDNFHKNDISEKHQEKGLFKNIKDKILFSHGRKGIFPIKGLKVNGKIVTAYFAYHQSTVYKSKEYGFKSLINNNFDRNVKGVIIYAIDKKETPNFNVVPQDDGKVVLSQEEKEAYKKRVIEAFYNKELVYNKEKNSLEKKFNLDTNKFDKLKQKLRDSNDKVEKEIEEKYSTLEQSNDKVEKEIEELKQKLKHLPEEEKFLKIINFIEAKIRLNDKKIADKNEKIKLQQEIKKLLNSVQQEFQKGKMLLDFSNFKKELENEKDLSKKLEMLKNKIKEISDKDEAYKKNHPVKHFINGVLKKSDRLDNKNWKLQRSVETKYFNY